MAEGRVVKRLNGYWKMELANAALVPSIFVFLAHSTGQGAGWVTYLTLVPVVGLLILGGLYWRAKWLQLLGERQALGPVMRYAHLLQWPLLASTIAAVALALAAIFLSLPGTTTTDAWAGSIAALLAVLEYVNYYHRQLQHFDNWPDFKRLITGNGLRQAWMARDLAAWRRQSLEARRR